MTEAVTRIARKQYESRVPEGNLKGAANKGTKAHELLMKIKNGEELKTNEVLTISGYRERSMAKVMKRTNAEVIAIEEPVRYVDENGRELYHGRIDMVAKMSEKYSESNGLMITDLKTENRIGSDHHIRLQTSAYFYAWNQMHPEQPADYICVIWLPDKAHGNLYFFEPLPLNEVLAKYRRRGV